MVRNLRQHMVAVHGMSKEEVDRITNKRKTNKEFLAQFTERRASGVGGQSASAAPPAGSSYSDAP